MEKTIGEIIGNLITMLYLKDVLTLDEFKQIIGEDNYNKLIESVKKEANNDSK